MFYRMTHREIEGLPLHAFSLDEERAYAGISPDLVGVYYRDYKRGGYYFSPGSCNLNDARRWNEGADDMELAN